jgi:GNAT superfamily N-acetyltransferase
MKIEMMNKDEGYKTFVALMGNKIVGFVAIEQSLDFVSPIGCLRINDLAVIHEYRRKGIGTKLMMHAEEYAKEKGLSSVILNSGIQRKDAHAFYEKLGYDKTSYCFAKKV